MRSFATLDHKGSPSACFFISDFAFEKSPKTMVEQLVCCQRIDQLANDTTQKPLPLQFKKAVAQLDMGESHVAVGKVHS
jgi:hypothetical protein